MISRQTTLDNQGTSSLIKHGLLESSPPVSWFSQYILDSSSLQYLMTPDLQDPNPRNYMFLLSRGFGGFKNFTQFIAFPHNCKGLAHILHLKATLLQKVGIGQGTSYFQWCRSTTFPDLYIYILLYIYYLCACFFRVQLVALGCTMLILSLRPEPLSSSFGVGSLVKCPLVSQKKIANS